MIIPAPKKLVTNVQLWWELYLQKKRRNRGVKPLPDADNGRDASEDK